MESEGEGLILIADDDEISRKLVKRYLEDVGYTVDETSTGREALDYIKTKFPDAILLDILMPEINGIEVCRFVKRERETMHVPIIILTAIAEEKYQLEGIKAGANDFLVKPIKREDLLLRVKNAVTLKKMYDSVENAYRQLQNLESMRDNLFHMIIHDLKQPISSISGFIQLLKINERSMEDPFVKECVGNIKDQIGVIVDIISSVIDINRMESDKMPVELKRHDITEVVGKVVEGFEVNAGNVRFNVKSDHNRVYAIFDTGLIYRVLLNLISNAIKWSPPDSNVDILIREEGQWVRVMVEDRGPGIPVEHKEKVFDKFWLANRKREYPSSSGLGLAFCKLAIEANGGSIGVDDRKGGGSVFWFTLRAA